MSLFHRKEAKEAPTPPPVRLAAKQRLELVLGASLSDLAATSTALVAAGQPPGRPGKLGSYSSSVEAGVDRVLGQLEQQLAEQRDALKRAIAAAETAETSDGDDDQGECARLRAVVQDLERRVRVVRALAPVAKLVSLRERLGEVEGELVVLDEQIRLHDRQARAPARLPTGAFGSGGGPRRASRSWEDAHALLCARREQARGQAERLRWEIESWKRENPSLVDPA